MGIIAPHIFIPTLQFPYENRYILEMLTPKIIISNPKRNDTKTIKIASSDEKPIYLKAFVKIKYTKYKIIIGIKRYIIHRPIFANS